MGVFGMTVEVAASIHSRMVSSSARSLIDSAANELRQAAQVSFSPAAYGVQPESGTILGYGSAVTAQSLASQLQSLQQTITSLTNELAGHIEGQRGASNALSGVNYAASAASGLFGAGLVRRYTTRAGVQYGPLIRHPNDPRIRWSNQGFGYNNRTVFTGNNFSSRWVNYNAATRVYGSANAWVSRLGSRMPVGAARALGPIGVVVGVVTSYSSGYDTQVVNDQGRGFTSEQMHSRAVTRGVSESVGSTVGAVTLGALGAAVGGPIGAVVGGMVGGWLGGLIGGAVGDAING